MPNAPNSPRCHVLIPCAGNGSRFGGDIPKQFQMLAGKRVIDHSLELFISMVEISSIWVGSSDPSLQLKSSLSKPIHVTPTGGKTRAETVLNTLKWMIDQQVPLTDWVLVHDAARPGVRKKDVQHLISAIFQDASLIQNKITKKANVSALTYLDISFGIDGMSGLSCGEYFLIQGVPEIYNMNGYFQITDVKQGMNENGWKTTIEAGYRLNSE